MLWGDILPGPTWPAFRPNHQRTQRGPHHPHLVRLRPNARFLNNVLLLNKTHLNENMSVFEQDQSLVLSKNNVLFLNKKQVLSLNKNSVLYLAQTQCPVVGQEQRPTFDKQHYIYTYMFVSNNFKNHVLCLTERHALCLNKSTCICTITMSCF